jgi:sphinganine-1-phosphate aldolase
MINMVYRGNAESCGATSYNMDDSSHCVAQAYMRWGKKHKGIRNPNIVSTSSVHPQWGKAFRNYDIELRKTSISPSGKVNLAEIKSLIDDNTVAILCSAPTIASGKFEPVPELAKIAREYQIGCHVDSTLGMFYPFLEEAGFDAPRADFSVPGVTSISVGLHTYGRMPFGCTVILWRTKQMRRF